MQLIIHYFLHLVFPLAIAYLFFRKDWLKVYFILLLTMLVDLDHLLATPLFQADRCSIAYHPLHSYYAMIGYIILLFLRRPFRIVGIGLLFHMATDFLDCLLMFTKCAECYVAAPAYQLLNWLTGILGI